MYSTLCRFKKKGGGGKYVIYQSWEKKKKKEWIEVIIALDCMIAKKINLEDFVSAFHNFVLFFSWVLVVSQSDE